MLDDYKAFASCSLLTSQQGWNRTMSTSDRTGMLQTEKKPRRSTLHKLGVMLCVQVTCSFLSHTNASICLNYENPDQVLGSVKLLLHFSLLKWRLTGQASCKSQWGPSLLILTHQKNFRVEMVKKGWNDGRRRPKSSEQLSPRLL